MPSASDFDPDQYREQVLEPARKLGGVLPADLLLRYAVPERTGPDAQAFEEHIAAILKHWRALKQKRVYASLAAGLLAAHADLAASGNLTYGYFAARRDEDQAAARRTLDRLAADLAATTTVVTRSTVRSLSTVLRGRLEPAAIEKALLGFQITVIEQDWALPDPPIGTGRSALAANLSVLGMSLVAEAVFGTDRVRAGFRLAGGFRLADGTRLNSERLDELKQTHARRALNERKTALDNVLATLGSVLDRPDELEALIVWQLIDVLQPQLAAGLPGRAIASVAAELGLDRREAAELALTLMNQPAGLDPARVAVQGALNAGKLFGARRRALALPADDELRQRIEGEVHRVDALIRDADAARLEGASETEAHLLTKALRIAADAEPGLRGRLEALAPPPPSGLVAAGTQEVVRLSWRASAARTGGVRYRVVRGIGAVPKTADAGSVVAETSQLRAVDENPPYGESLHYRVFAARGPDAWSAGSAAGEPVLVLADVRHPEVESQDEAIVGSWQLPARAVDVLVGCQPGSAPDWVSQGRQIPATITGFRDAQAKPGVHYYYRICAVYLGQDGRRWISPGVVRSATAELPMDAVQGLQAEIVPGEDPRVILSWPAPEHGSVLIFRHQAPGPWPPGGAVRLDELSRLARPLAGSIQYGDDQVHRITARPQDGRNYFTAMTVGVHQALVGSTVAFSFVTPVSQLRARRYENQVKLWWDWPEGTHVCRIHWAAEDSGPAGQSADCIRRRYFDDGGFEITVDSRPTLVSVCAVRRDAEGETTSPPVTVTVPRDDVHDSEGFRRHRWTPRLRRARVDGGS